MRCFAEAWPDEQIVLQAVDQPERGAVLIVSIYGLHLLFIHSLLSVS